MFKYLFIVLFLISFFYNAQVTTEGNLEVKTEKKR